MHLIQPVCQGPVCTKQEILDQRISSEQAVTIRRLFNSFQQGQAPLTEAKLADMKALAQGVGQVAEDVGQAQQDLQTLEQSVQSQEEAKRRNTGSFSQQLVLKTDAKDPGRHDEGVREVSTAVLDMN